MNLKELSTTEFTTFAQNHPLSNYFQTISYAMLMAECGYDYDLIGMTDENDNIVAASMILIKPIGIKCFYGYAPRGFLVDYENSYLVSTFTEKLKKYYYNKDVIFIKTNPNIVVGEINPTNFETTHYNKDITSMLSSNGYKKLKDNLYFESKLPRFNAIVDLKSFNTSKLNKNTKNKIKKGIRKGLVFEKYDKSYLEYLINLNKSNNNKYFYEDFYTVFERENNVDLFLVSIDYNSFLENSQYIYNKELEKNLKMNEKLTRISNDKTINAKMNSDKVLLSYKNDIMEATKGISDNENIFIAGALVVRHNDTVNIIYSGFDKNYKRFAPNYFLHYNIIKYYQNNYNYLDLNGMTGDFSQSNPYHGLNRFKLGFNPNIYEYIGEFDLIVEPKSYEILLRNGILAKEFNKPNLKKINKN